MTTYWVIKVNDSAVDCQANNNMTYEQAENYHIVNRVSIMNTLMVLGYKFTIDYECIDHDDFVENIASITTQE